MPTVSGRPGGPASGVFLTEDEGRSLYGVTESVVYGLVAGSSSAGVKTANAAAIQAALDGADGAEVFIPEGTFYTDPVRLTGPVELRGVGQTATTLRNDSGSVFVCALGENVNVSHLTARSDGGGATVTQTGVVAQSTWSFVDLIQTDDDESVWDNNGHGLVDMRFLDGYSQHTQTATVPSWNLVDTGGSINDNVWQRWRAQFSGDYHWWVESTSANAHYMNAWRDITFEVCTGGLIRLISVQQYVIDNCVNWDMNAGSGVTTLQQHGIYATANGSGIACHGQISNQKRLAGSNATDIQDVMLPSSGLGAGTLVYNCRNIPTSSPYLIDLKDNTCWIQAQTTSLTTYSNTAGAMRIGVLEYGLGATFIKAGTGSPEGVVTATKGSVFLRSDGTLGSTLYVKQAGTGNTGWTPFYGEGWTSYTPTLAGTGWAIGDGTITASYTQIGKTVHWRARIVFGSTSTFGASAAPTVTLPVTGQAPRHVVIAGDATDSGVANYNIAGRQSADGTLITCYVTGTNGVLSNITASSPFTWVSGDILQLAGTYEAA